MKKQDVKKISRNRQRALLAVGKPDFQEEVLQLRKKFLIPPEGIKTNEESSEWHHNFYISDDDYYNENRPKIYKELSRLRKSKKFREAFDLERKVNEEGPINAFHIAIKKILKKYKLPLGWEHSVQRYVLFNSVDLMWLPGNVAIREDIDQHTNLRRLSIEIDDTTTLEDIRKVWPYVEFHQKKLDSYISDKFHPIPNLDRDKRAFELQKEGKTIDEIGTILSEEFQNGGLDNNQISIVIKRYKKRFNIG